MEARIKKEKEKEAAKEAKRLRGTSIVFGIY